MAKVGEGKKEIFFDCRRRHCSKIMSGLAAT